MFDPSIGRWLEMDPIAFDAGDANLYRFGGNNPTNATDPSGLAVSEGPALIQITPDVLRRARVGITRPFSLLNGIPLREGLTKGEYSALLRRTNGSGPPLTMAEILAVLPVAVKDEKNAVGPLAPAVAAQALQGEISFLLMGKIERDLQRSVVAEVSLSQILLLVPHGDRFRKDVSQGTEVVVDSLLRSLGDDNYDIREAAQVSLEILVTLGSVLGIRSVLDPRIEKATKNPDIELRRRAKHVEEVAATFDSLRGISLAVEIIKLEAPNKEAAREIFDDLDTSTYFSSFWKQVGAKGKVP